MSKKLLLLLMVAMLSLMGCVDRAGVRYSEAEPHYQHPGPPPHAPAHGYRAKYHDHDLIYDSGLEAYLVVGRHDYYFNDGMYFRYRDDRWQFSVRLDSNDWHDAHYEQMPHKLYYSKGDKHSHKEHGKKVPPGQEKKWKY